MNETKFCGAELMTCDYEKDFGLESIHRKLITCHLGPGLLNMEQILESKITDVELSNDTNIWVFIGLSFTPSPALVVISGPALDW